MVGVRVNFVLCFFPQKAFAMQGLLGGSLIEDDFRMDLAGRFFAFCCLYFNPFWDSSS